MQPLCRECGQRVKALTYYEGAENLSGYCAECAYKRGFELGKLMQHNPHEARKILWPKGTCPECNQYVRIDPNDYICEDCRNDLRGS